MFESLGEYDKAKENLEKALAMTIDIGDKKGVGRCYGNLGTVFKSLGEYDEAKNTLRKHLSSKEKLVTDKEKQVVMET